MLRLPAWGVLHLAFPRFSVFHFHTGVYICVRMRVFGGEGGLWCLGGALGAGGFVVSYCEALECP